MATMRALAAAAVGPLDGLKITELPVPEPGPGMARIRVVASAVNPADQKILTGETSILHGKRLPLVVGYDFSGAVDALGPGATGFAVGDEVFGFCDYSRKTKQGAWAEFVEVPVSTLARKPASVTHAIAAAAATPGITALQAIRDRGRFTGGRVLVSGASGGVGSLALGIVRKLGGTAAAICSTPAVEFVRSLGAEQVLDRKQQDPMTAAQGPFDVFLDAAAAYSWSASKHLLKPGGSYVVTLPSLRFGRDKLLSLVASTRVDFVLVKPKPKDLELLGSWLAEGMTVPIDSTFPLRDARAAMEKLSRGELRGRISIDAANGF